MENVGESSGNKAAYSFRANADTLNYDYVSAYQTKPDPSPSRNQKRAYQKTTQESTHPTTMRLTMLNLLTTNLIVITAINQTTLSANKATAK